MNARFLVIAAALLAAGSAASAEPPKAPAKDMTPQVNRNAPVLLASADQVTPPAPADQNAQPPVKRPRAARVTTCRCGDQIAEAQR